MVAGAYIRRTLWPAFFVCFLVLGMILVPDLSWAAAAHKSSGGLKGWIAGFSAGSGALIINPIIILIQWVNFVVLLIVLNKILYKPLWVVIEKRNAQVEGDLASAERDKSESQGYITQYEDSLAEIRRESSEAMAVLQQEINEAGRKQIEEIRDQTSRELEEARVSIASQVEAAASELENRAKEFSGQIVNRLAGRQIA